MKLTIIELIVLFVVGMLLGGTIIKGLDCVNEKLNTAISSTLNGCK